MRHTEIMRRITGALAIIFVLCANQGVVLASATPSKVRLEIMSGVRVTGTVTLSPVCPVARNPPDPACAPKPYRTALQIRHRSSGTLAKTVSTSTSGTFVLTLAPGAYVLQVKKGVSVSIYPRCTPIDFVVAPRKPLHLEMSCDTGIR